MKTIKIGSRASKLALVQAELIIEELRRKFPQYNYEIVKIITKGDEILDKTIDKIGGKGVFVKEIQTALINQEVDLAVHSMKDMPYEPVEELMLGAITRREDPRDVLVMRDNMSWEQLNEDAVIGSSSLRRQAQLLYLKPGLVIKPLRGNVETRMRKIESESLDGIILAAAGLKRLGLTECINHYFSMEEFIPAVGQGALGCEIRKSDQELYEMLQELNHQETYHTVMAERSFLSAMEGGCHVPIGAYGRIVGNEIVLTGMVASPTGIPLIKETESGNLDDFIVIGEKLAEKMFLCGAREILDKYK